MRLRLGWHILLAVVLCGDEAVGEVIHWAVFLDEALYVLCLEDQAHVVAVDGQVALDGLAAFVLSLDAERVAQILAWHTFVLFLVQHLVMDDGIVELFLLVPFYLQVVVRGRFASRVYDACLDVLLAIVHAHYQEGQTHLLLIACRQGEVVLSEEHLASIHLEV